jgi:hypothetical protein
MSETPETPAPAPVPAAPAALHAENLNSATMIAWLIIEAGVLFLAAAFWNRR